MSVICRHFVQNAWRKDLCSNCFKSEEEHAPGAPLGPRADPLRGLDELTHRYSPASRASSPALSDLLVRTGGAGGSLSLKSTALLRGLQSRQDEAAMVRLDAAGRSGSTDAGGRLASSRLVALARDSPARDSPDRADAAPVHAAVNRTLVETGPSRRARGILVLDGRGGGRQRRTVAFAEEHEVIGVGGDPAESDDECYGPDEPGEPEPAGTLDAEERKLLSLTQRNTDFNSINSNLSGTSRTMVDWLDDNDRTTERSALTGRHKKFTPLVSIAPFSSGPRSNGGVKVNLVAPMKNGEIITESRNRFEMVEKRSATDPVATKMAEKITRLDDLIDEKPKKIEEDCRSTTSVEITNTDSVRNLATESVSITEFADSSRNTASPPPLVETRLSFAIGGRRGAPPKEPTPDSATQETGHPRLPAAPAPRRSEPTVDDSSLEKVAASAASQGTEGVEVTNQHQSPFNDVKGKTEEARFNRESAILATEENVPKSLVRVTTSSNTPSPVKNTRTGKDEVKSELCAKEKNDLSNDGVPNPSQEADIPKLSCTRQSGTMGSLTAEVLEAVDKAFSRSSGGSLVTLRAGKETSLTSITSDSSEATQCGPTRTSNLSDNILSGLSKHPVSFTPMDAQLSEDKSSAEETSLNGLSSNTQEKHCAAEEATQTNHSSALQKLINEDVDNQNEYNRSMFTMNRQMEERNGVDDCKLEPEKAFSYIKSRFTEKSMSPKEDICPQKRLDSAALDSANSSITNVLSKLPKDNLGREVGEQPKVSTLTSSSPAKPSPRASFLHSLTNSKPDDTESSFTNLLASTLSADVTQSLTKEDESSTGNQMDKTETGNVKAPLLNPRVPVAKVSEDVIRSSSKPSGSAAKPPILREKPKIAAKPAKLHRLSRATSVEGDSSPRLSPDIRCHSVDRDAQKSEPNPVEELPKDAANAGKLDGGETGAVCVAVKSPVLDASTRLTKLVESAKPALEEPKAKSHLTISVSPPRPPVRKESLTRKERTMQRERELEKQREELEKRHREEQTEEQDDTAPAEVRKEHRLAPQPPTHRSLKRTVSGDEEPVREHRQAPQPPVHQTVKRTVSHDSEVTREKRLAPEPPGDLALKRTLSSTTETNHEQRLTLQSPMHLDMNKVSSTDSSREQRLAPKPPGDGEPKRPVSKDYEANRTAIANLLSLGHHSSAIKRQAPKAPDSLSSQEDSAESSPQVAAKGSARTSPEVGTKPRQTSRVWSDSPLEDDTTGDSESCTTDVAADSGSSDHMTSDVSDEHVTKRQTNYADEGAHKPCYEESDESADENQSAPRTNGVCAGTKTDSLQDNSEHDHQANEQIPDGDVGNDVTKPSSQALSNEGDKNSTSEDTGTPESTENSPSGVVDPKPEAEPIPPITLKVESALPAPALKEQASDQSDEVALQGPGDPTQADSTFSPSTRIEATGKLVVKDDSNPYASTAIFDRHSSFKPDIDDEDDLPPSASMRSSSVSPRSRKRASNVVSFDPGAEYYSRETVLIKPRSQSMPRHVEGLMTDEEVKQKIYGVSATGVFGAGVSGGERRSRRDEPKRRGKFSLKKFLKFGKEDKKGGKEDKKKDKDKVVAMERAKPEIIHPLDLTAGTGGVQVIVRTEEEKRRDEAERQRKKALLIAEGTRVYDSPSFSKGPLSSSGRPTDRPSPSSPSTPSGPASTPWQHGSLGFNSEGRPKPPPPPRRTSSIDQTEVSAATPAPTRPPPPHPDTFSRAREGSERVTGPRQTEYANLGTNRAGLTPRKPDRGGSVRNESPKLHVAFDTDDAELTSSQGPAPPSAAESVDTADQPEPGGSPTPAVEQELPRQRPSRVSLRKQLSVVHANLEENYDAVTASNHEALLQLLDQVSGRKPVPASLQPLEHNPALAFTHFKVSAESHVTCGRRAFLRAEHREQPVLLMLSSEPTVTPAASLQPVAMFRDLVQGHLLPRASTGSYTSAMQATLWVFPPARVRPLWEVVCSQPAVSGPQQEQQVCLLLLQTVHHLLQLQARGQLFVDQSLCELLAAEVDGDSQSRVVAVYGNYESRQKLTGCQAALVVMLRALGVQDALERVRDGRGVSVPDVPSLNAFELLSSLLLREDATALSRARAVLEFLLWGPADLELTEGESSLQRWLDLERATVLNNLIRTQKLWSVELSVLEEFRLMFLVNTDSATLKDASELLDI